MADVMTDEGEVKTVHVDVTQDDIDMAKRYDCYECPVALALGEIVTGSVGIGWGLLLYNGNGYNIPNDTWPRVLRPFIERFYD